MKKNVEVIDVDPIRKEAISEALKVLRTAVKEMEYLQEYNFGGLYDPNCRVGHGLPSPEGHVPAKHILLNLGHEIVTAGAEVLRCAADLNDEEE